MSLSKIKYLKDEAGNIISPVTSTDSVFSRTNNSVTQLFRASGVTLLKQWTTYQSTTYDISDISFSQSGFDIDMYSMFIFKWRLYDVTHLQGTAKFGCYVISKPIETRSNFCIGLRWYTDNEGGVWECINQFSFNISDGYIKRDSSYNSNAMDITYNIHIYDLYGIRNMDSLL